MFKRKRDRSAKPDLDRNPDRNPKPDPDLPALSVADAASLGELARRAFAEQGLETLYDGAGSLVGADGHRYGLHNLSIALADANRRDWPRLVAEHAAAMASTQLVAMPTSLDEARDLLLLKIAVSDQVPAGVPTYAPEVLPGVVALVALDYPTHVNQLTNDDALEPFGGWAAVEPVALANLRRLEAPQHTVLQPGEDADSAVHLFASDDFYGASRVLLLDELLTGVLLVERPTYGVLLAVPNRHLLAVHVVTGESAVAAMSTMVPLAVGESDARAGGLSPFLYYRAADGRTQQVSRAGDDGKVVVEVTGAFEEVWRALGLLTDG